MTSLSLKCRLDRRIILRLPYDIAKDLDCLVENGEYGRTVSRVVRAAIHALYVQEFGNVQSTAGNLSDTPIADYDRLFPQPEGPSGAVIQTKDDADRPTRAEDAEEVQIDAEDVVKDRVGGKTRGTRSNGVHTPNGRGKKPRNPKGSAGKGRKERGPKPTIAAHRSSSSLPQRKRKAKA